MIAVTSTADFVRHCRARPLPVGTLAEAHGFVDDTGSLALWKSRRDEPFGETERLDTKAAGVLGYSAGWADALAGGNLLP